MKWHILEDDYPENHRSRVKAAYLRHREVGHRPELARTCARNDVYGIPLPHLDWTGGGNTTRAVVSGTDSLALENWLLRQGLLEPDRWTCTFSYEFENDSLEDSYTADCYSPKYGGAYSESELTSKYVHRPHGSVAMRRPGARNEWVWFVAPTHEPPKGMSRGAGVLWQAEQRRLETESHVNRYSDDASSLLYVSAEVVYDDTDLVTEGVGMVEVNHTYSVNNYISEDLWFSVMISVAREAPTIRERLLEERAEIDARLTRIAERT